MSTAQKTSKTVLSLSIDPRLDQQLRALAHDEQRNISVTAARLIRAGLRAEGRIPADEVLAEQVKP